MSFKKNRNRGEYTFANINLLGKCNIDCFFCLGKDLEEELAPFNHLNIHYSDWENFTQFIRLAKEKNIENIYITGQNCDSLQYKYLSRLINLLQAMGFDVGLRTNGYLALKNMKAINKCERSVGYTIQSLNPETNDRICGRKPLPDWNTIIPNTKNCRVQIVINRWNYHEVFDIIKYVSQFKNVKYIQVRRVGTDTRKEELAFDATMFDIVYEDMKKSHNPIKSIHGAEIYNYHGIDVSWWKTTETSANSINYFTDGTISDNYFIIEGYLKAQKYKNLIQL